MMIAIVKTCGRLFLLVVMISALLFIFSLVGIFVLGALIALSFNLAITRQYSLITKD